MPFKISSILPFLFNLNIIFPDLLNLYTPEPGHFIVIPEIKYKENKIFLKNYFKIIVINFLVIQLQSPNIYNNR